MDKNTALNHARKYAEILKGYMTPAAVVLNGSYVNGTQTDELDIDIAVIFDSFNGDFLETSALLYQLTCEVDTSIEPILLDVSKDNSGFAREVIRTGQQIA